MEVLEKDIGNIRVIALSGELTSDNAEPLCAAVDRALPNPGRIVLDLAEMRGIDRTGIGVLAMLLDQTKNNGHPLKLKDDGEHLILNVQPNGTTILIK